MKKSGGGAVFVLALAMITGLSVMYWKDVGEKLTTVSSSVNGKEIPICSVEKEVPQVSLTFDVAGSNRNLEEILDILERQQTRATFFVTGEWVEKYPESAKKILDAGHDLGNSGERGRQACELSAEECRKEIMRLHTRVKELTGCEMNLFRPALGEYDDTVIKTVYACGYYPVYWNIDSMDWKNYGEDDMIRCVTENENLENGAIILFHSNAGYIKEALENILSALREEGYTAVPVSELIYKNNYCMNIFGKQISLKI